MAHITDLGFTVEDLFDARDAGDVRYQTHPEFQELTVWNYTEDVQYRNKWNKITLACRGLIINTVTGEVVARPWEKFFNLGQMDNRIDSDAPVEVTDKMDGSLGILYQRPDGAFAIATRGSFASEQAIEATKMLHETPEYRQEVSIPDGITFLFEIIYPQNRIVVNYGDQRDLVLLGAVSNQYGFYYGPLEAAGMLNWPGPVTESWHFDSFVDAISFPDRDGKEGVVIRSGRNIVKLKQADYVELHRIVTNLSPKTIWVMIGEGKTVADICAGIPDEFHKYVEDIGNGLLQDASDIEYRVRSGYLMAKQAAEAKAVSGPDMSVSRKAYANEIKKYKDAKYMFLLLDGKGIRDQIWKHIKPRGDIKSLVEDEG